MTSLEHDARVSDLLNRLDDPTGYVQGVLGNFVSCGFDPQTCKIRIGITGEGVAPNYKIEEPPRSETLRIKTGDSEKPFDATFTVIPGKTFSGRHHRELIELDDMERRDEHWSTASMTFAELQQLRSTLIESKGFH